MISVHNTMVPIEQVSYWESNQLKRVPGKDGAFNIHI